MASTYAGSLYWTRPAADGFTADIWTPKGSTMAAVTLLMFACGLGVMFGAGLTP